MSAKADPNDREGARGSPAPFRQEDIERLAAGEMPGDIVTVIHKVYRQDPTAETGKFYEAFTFDSFRVRNGKLVEHWDGAVINPPAGTPAGGRGQ